MKNYRPLIPVFLIGALFLILPARGQSNLRDKAVSNGAAPDAQQTVRVSFANLLPQDVDLYIINPRSNEPVSLGPVKTNGVATRVCYPDHRWVFAVGGAWLKSSDGSPVSYVTALEAEQGLVIRGAESAARKTTASPAAELVFADVKVAFRNGRNAAVDLYLVNPKTEEPVFRATLAAGEEKTVSCYPGHLWVMAVGNEWLQGSDGELLSYETRHAPLQRFEVPGGAESRSAADSSSHAAPRGMIARTPWPVPAALPRPSGGGPLRAQQSNDPMVPPRP